MRYSATVARLGVAPHRVLMLPVAHRRVTRRFERFDFLLSMFLSHRQGGCPRGDHGSPQLLCEATHCTREGVSCPAVPTASAFLSLKWRPRQTRTRAVEGADGLS